MAFFSIISWINFDTSSFSPFLEHMWHIEISCMAMVYGWLVVGILFLILELLSAGLLFFFPFTVGAVFSATSVMLGLDIIPQSFIFLLVSIISFFLMRSYFIAQKDRKAVLTNVDALVNQIGFVTKAIHPPAYGRVKIKSEEWLAVSQKDEILPEHTKVMVIQVSGTKVVVKRF